MKRLVLLSLIIIGFASCDSPIKDGNLVYLSLRKGNNLSLNNNGQFQCFDEKKTPLIFKSRKNGVLTLKTEDGLGVVVDNYYLFAREEEPSFLKLDTLKDNNIYLLSLSNRYFGCNGKEVYETYEPFISIHKY